MKDRIHLLLDPRHAQANGWPAALLLLPLIALGGLLLAPASGRSEEKLRKELSSPYSKWLREDALYIVTVEERKTFDLLSTDEQREQFIEQFWRRRDPAPGTAVNEFKQEHYRRIAYANERFFLNAGSSSRR